MKISISIDLLDLFKGPKDKKHKMIEGELVEDIEIKDGAVYLGADDSLSSKSVPKMGDIQKANKPELRSVELLANV